MFMPGREIRMSPFSQPAAFNLHDRKMDPSIFDRQCGMSNGAETQSLFDNYPHQSTPIISPVSHPHSHEVAPSTVSSASSTPAHAASADEPSSLSTIGRFSDSVTWTNHFDGLHRPYRRPDGTDCEDLVVTDIGNDFLMNDREIPGFVGKFLSP